MGNLCKKQQNKYACLIENYAKLVDTPEQNDRIEIGSSKHARFGVDCERGNEKESNIKFKRKKYVSRSK